MNILNFLKYHLGYCDMKTKGIQNALGFSVNIKFTMNSNPLSYIVFIFLSLSERKVSAILPPGLVFIFGSLKPSKRHKTRSE